MYFSKNTTNKPFIVSVKLQVTKLCKVQVMRPTLVLRLHKAHPELTIEETYGYITKYQRIKLKLSKTHCADVYCISGN